jgi:hypothetical protein
MDKAQKEGISELIRQIIMQESVLIKVMIRIEVLMKILVI